MTIGTADRFGVIRVLLVVYFLGSVAIALALLLDLGRSGDLAATTSGKILAAALFAMGIGALRAARDPWGQRLVVEVLILFTALSAMAIVYRLAVERHHHDLAWLVLPFALAAPVLLASFYPRRGPTRATDDG